MRNKNRIIAFLMAVILFVPMIAVSAGVQTELSETELMDLKTFRLMEDGVSLEEPFSRAAFAKLTVRLLDMDRVAYQVGAADCFSDVPASYWASSYIYILKNLGIVSGNGATSFYPERPISYSEAVKILISAMGYTTYAQQEGGYPGGYQTVAARLGMAKGVYADSTLTYADALQLAYNCLDIQLMEQEFGSGKYYLSDATPRSILLGNEEVGMIKLKGIVQANFNSYLDNPVVGINEDEILFYNMLVKTGASGAEKYLGYEVEAYLSTSDGIRYTVEMVRPTAKNTVTTVLFEEIEVFSESSFSYLENEKEREFSLEQDVIILFNGRPTDYKTAVKHMKNGSVTLLSNDENKEIDIVFINSYESAVIESINYESAYMVFGGNKTINGQKLLRFDDSNDYLQFYFQDAEGNFVDAKNIKNGDIVSVFSDINGQLIVSRKGLPSVFGAISAISTDEITYATINGTEYAVEPAIASEISIGATVEAFLNFENKIAYIKESDDAVLYGAIVGTAKKGLSNTCLQVLIPGSIADEREQAEDPDDEEIVSLAAKNAAIEKFTLADFVNYRGTRLSDADVKQEIDNIISGMGHYVVKYKLNSNGEISHLDVPEQLGSPYSKIYNADERTFGGTSGGAFGVCDTTKAICVPSNQITSDMDYMTKIKMSDGRSYHVTSYSYNEDTYCVDLFVIKEAMVYETTGSISSTSKIGLVESVVTKADENGDCHTYVTLVTDSGKTQKIVSEDTSSSFDFTTLMSGDFICYSLDTLDRLDGAQLLVHSAPVPPSRIDEKTYTVYSGLIADTEYNVVSESLNRWVDLLYFTTEDGRETRFEIRQSGTPPIYLYHSSNSTAQIGTAYDLMRNHKRVVVCTKGTTVKAVLIIE